MTRYLERKGLRYAIVLVIWLVGMLGYAAWKWVAG